MSGLLDVAAALIGVYVAFALLASWINERIASWLQLRANCLLAGIERLVGADDAPAILASPFITAASGRQSGRGRFVTRTLVGGAPAGGRPPSYISGAQFSSAVMEWLQRQRAAHVAALRTTLQSELARVPATLSAGLSAALQSLLERAASNETLAASLAAFDAGSALPGTTLAPAETEFLRTIQALAAGKADVFSAALSQNAGDANKKLAALLDALPENALRAQLLSLFTSAEGDVGAFVGGVQGWFDDQMDRVSGWYKRQNQWIVIVISLSVAALFSVDTIAIYQRLANDPAAAARGAAFAAALASAQGQAAAPDADSVIKPVACQSGTSGDACICPQGYLLAAPGAAAPAPCRFDAAFLSELPLGWRGDEVVAHWRELEHGSQSGLTWWFYKLLGIGLSGIAISLGAPFWFDLLSRITAVRSAGPKPNPSADDTTTAGAASR